jgi:hypothetical protein
MTYALDDQHGTQFCGGLTLAAARSLARRLADERNEPVSLYGDGDGDTAVTVYPSGTLLLVETMPTHLVASHKAARNFGSFPANGAERAIVDAADVDTYLDDNGYDHVVRAATARDVERYGDVV